MIFAILDVSPIKKIDDCESIYSVNPLYLIIGKVDGYIERKSKSKYLIFDPSDENKEVFKESTQNFRMALKLKLKQ